MDINVYASKLGSEKAGVKIWPDTSESPATMLSLANELLEKIFLESSAQDLTSLALTNQRIRLNVTRVLYRNVTLYSADNIAAWAETVKKNAPLADLARCVDLCIEGDMQRLQLPPSIPDLVHDALMATRCVTHLRLCFTEIDEDMLDGLTFPELQSFSTILDITKVTSKFLERHPYLQRLRFAGEFPIATLQPSGRGFFQLHSGSLSGLRFFSGSSILAEMVVPGNPVEQVGLIWPSCTQKDICNVFKALGRSTGPVKILIIRVQCWDEAFAEGIARLRGIRVLKVYLQVPDEGEEIWKTIKFKEFFKALKHQLPHLHHLRDLYLQAGSPFYHNFLKGVRKEAEIIPELSRLQPALKTVSLGGPFIWRHCKLRNGWIWMPDGSQFVVPEWTFQPSQLGLRISDIDSNQHAAILSRLYGGASKSAVDDSDLFDPLIGGIPIYEDNEDDGEE